MKPSLPILLSGNGGYVDTVGFLALHGLFTAHVTGNFVTLGASLVLGTSGAIGKLLALPVFCVVVMFVRLFGDRLAHGGAAPLRALLLLQCLLLAAGGALAIALGPFTDADSLPGLATGMTLVCAMAVQNAVHRIHLADSPPSTLMTGTTTQVMIDLADLLRGPGADRKAPIQARLARLSKSLAAFAAGCAAGALAYVWLGLWSFVPPVLIAMCAWLAARPDSASAAGKNNVV